MAVQITNCYGYNVKRISLMAKPQAVYSGQGAGSTGPWLNPGGWTTAGGIAALAGVGGYQGEQVFVIASSPANALAVLQAQYGSDLGPVTGGGTHIPGALTTMTGN
jgi:hypothetical protein